MDSTITIPDNTKPIMNDLQPFKKTGIGERLRAARLAMQLSEKEAAARLHLNANIIVLLEKENFSDGPPAAFIRGYLRSYAKLVNLPDHEITATLKELAPSRTTLASIPLVQTKKYNERYFHWLTYLIVIVLVMLVSVWWSSHSRYVIADIPPAHPTTVSTTPTAPAATPLTDTKPGTTLATTSTPAASAPTTPNLAPPANTSQSALPQAAPEPTIAVTPNPQSPTIAAKSKPASKATTPAMGMVLPEPGADDDN